MFGFLLVDNPYSIYYQQVRSVQELSETGSEQTSQ